MLRLSLRYQLGFALILLNIVGTAVTATIAYRESRQLLEQDAISEAGRAAHSRQQSLLGLLRARQTRLAAFLASLEPLCGEQGPTGDFGWERQCVRVALTGFHRSEQASATELRYQGRRLASRGTWPRLMPPVGMDQLAYVSSTAGVGEYWMQAFRHDMILRVRFPLTQLNTMFADRSGLGANGEILLTDRRGQMLTPPRFTAATWHPTLNAATEECVRGSELEMRDWDYRAVPIITGVRPVPEIGGGCVVANLTQADALAPVDGLLTFYATASAIVIGMGGVLSVLIAGWATWPLHRLAASAKRFAAGELEAPVPIAGSSEVRHLGQALSTMAQSIRELLEREHTARLEAETANRTKDGFLATLSHELRTPLGAILGWTAILKRGEHPPEFVARAVDVIDRSARTQSRMVEELLDVSRIVAGTQRLVLGKVSVSVAVDAALDAIRPAADAKGVTIARAIEVVDRKVTADAQRLQQILWNLLSNAVRFTPRGGRVELTVRDVDGDTEIQVADTGSGIPAAFLPHIFERFRQAQPTSGTHGGLGLGLAIVRDLVHLHGGTVRAESPGEGKGATFIVRLPSVPATVAEPPAEHPVSLSPNIGGLALGGAKVLVVDDDADARDAIRRILEGAGAQVDVAGSARETRRLMETVRPDLLIADLGMPEEDGYSLIRSIRKKGPDADHLPAIALTAHAAPEDVAKALASGFQLHMAKPFDSSRLVASIATLVAAHN